MRFFTFFLLLSTAWCALDIIPAGNNTLIGKLIFSIGIINKETTTLTDFISLFQLSNGNVQKIDFYIKRFSYNKLISYIVRLTILTLPWSWITTHLLLMGRKLCAPPKRLLHLDTKVACIKKDSEQPASFWLQIAQLRILAGIFHCSFLLHISLLLDFNLVVDCHFLRACEFCSLLTFYFFLRIPSEGTHSVTLSSGTGNVVVHHVCTLDMIGPPVVPMAVVWNQPITFDLGNSTLDVFFH